MYKIVAQDMALAAVNKDYFCDVKPEVIRVTTDALFPNLVMVRVKYNSFGMTALYSYDVNSGTVTEML